VGSCCSWLVSWGSPPATSGPTPSSVPVPSPAASGRLPRLTPRPRTRLPPTTSASARSACFTLRLSRLRIRSRPALWPGPRRRLPKTGWRRRSHAHGVPTPPAPPSTSSSADLRTSPEENPEPPRPTSARPGVMCHGTPCLAGRDPVRGLPRTTRAWAACRGSFASLGWHGRRGGRWESTGPRRAQGSRPICREPGPRSGSRESPRALLRRDWRVPRDVAARRERPTRPAAQR
jgi:hypothetical protein